MAFNLDDGGEDGVTSSLLSKESSGMEYGSFSEEVAVIGYLQKRVSFHNISYEVSQRSCCRKLPPKTILHNISGVMKTGLNAIMGPTGSGKTSLLDILAGHKDRKGLSGLVMINGQYQPVNFKCKSAYVVQDDVVMGTLTVRENIAFSAALRLPSTYTRRDRRQKVDLVIKELGLTHVADSKIGTEYIRGISGGERKRTNIGMELIIAPGILFLDEPTTGLDASTAISVIRLLKDLSKEDRVIIISIHQPRYSIYKLFDTLTLLSKGELVYHGIAGDFALQYFNSLGYECERHDNPADFFLDVVFQNEVEKCEGDVGKGVTCNKLALAYKESSEFNEIGSELSSILDQAVKGHKQYAQFSTSLPWQFLILSIRNIRNIIRNPMVSIVQVIVMIIFAAVVGLIYFQLDTDYGGFQNRVGAFFFIIMNVVFGNLSAVELFIKERPVFIHQSATGYYRVSSYFFAKILCDLLPMRFLPVIFFSAISYWMIGFKKDLLNFAIYLLTMLLTSSAASAIAFFISAGVSVFALANLCVALSFVFQMVFGGFLLNLNTLGSWISWIQYLSIFRYSLNALFENELKGVTFCDTFFNQTDDSFECQQNLTVYGDVYLRSLDYMDYNIWFNELALFLYIIVILTFAYITLRSIKKHK
ncbi:broad substrate specificity ATP-binding cassette transporter ABCG2-like [Dysidea avara]|uniref:broad substrate specificity ATP-binding cassette transporter ABCG2-like n=1 Tax=Dysidea avara TaxID=196820 RepID=UPI0033212E0E